MQLSLTCIAVVVAAALLPSTVVCAQSTDELFKQAAALDQKFEAGEALKCYCEIAKHQPKNAAVQARIARQYRHLMADAAGNEEKLRLGRLALEHSQNAVDLAPKLAEAQLSVAITYGKMLPLLGKKEQVQTSPRIKTAVDATLQLDPRNDLAWHVLGRWHRILADVGGMKRMFAGALYGALPKGSNEEAVRCLQKAIALNPNRPMHFIELGRAYAQMGKKEDARKMINKGLSMPNTDKDDPEVKARGRETLAELG